MAIAAAPMSVMALPLKLTMTMNKEGDIVTWVADGEEQGCSSRARE